MKQKRSSTIVNRGRGSLTGIPSLHVMVTIKLLCAIWAEYEPVIVEYREIGALLKSGKTCGDGQREGAQSQSGVYGCEAS